MVKKKMKMAGSGGGQWREWLVVAWWLRMVAGNLVMAGRQSVRRGNQCVCVAWW